jgi:cyclopropane fatty-acyl-phospholipid synthase-like methyltransferase
MTSNENINAMQIAAKKCGISSKSVLWDDPQTQYLRFYELVKNLDLNDHRKTVLDVGCGNGELYKFLNFVGCRGRYVGYDINEMLLDQARNRFQGIDVQSRDIMIEDITQRFDYVVPSGLFNINVGQSSDWIKNFLEKMYALSNEVLVFNMISTHVTYRDEGMFYMDPAEVLSFCISNLSKRTTLAHHNLPYNYTVTVYKDETWTSVREVVS